MIGGVGFGLTPSLWLKIESPETPLKQFGWKADSYLPIDEAGVYVAQDPTNEPGSDA